MMKIYILIPILLIILFPSSANPKKNSKENQTEKNDSMEDAIKFITEEDPKQKKEIYLTLKTMWNYDTNITDETYKKKDDASKEYDKSQEKLVEKAQKYKWQSFKNKNETLYRWFKLSTEMENEVDSPNKANLFYRSGSDDMPNVFNKAKLCSFDKSKRKCDLKLEPDIEDIFMYSKNPEELKYYWKESRDKTGKKIRQKFIEGVKTKNKDAKKKGYADRGALDLAAYESKSIVEDTKKIMMKLLPFYKQMHAYVRRKLKSYYKNVTIKDNGPIPAHLLVSYALGSGQLFSSRNILGTSQLLGPGILVKSVYNGIQYYLNFGLKSGYEFVSKIRSFKESPRLMFEIFGNCVFMLTDIPIYLECDLYAQEWTGIFSIVDPYPKNTAPNVTSAMVKKNMKAIDMFLMAEKFFVSIGLKKMTPHFWHYSVIEKPPDREFVCHGSAVDFHDGKDFRIKMCATIDAKMLQIIHHEMGHIQYFMHYSHHLLPFQQSANPGIVSNKDHMKNVILISPCIGFHEAIGDTTSLSANTPSYLMQVGLLQKNETGNSKKYDISYLMNMALQFVTRIPYSYVMSYWNNRVLNGTIKKEELNKKYWEYRLKYQGICPPVKRTEKDFDIGAKYHIVYDVEFLRYFFSSVLQFQIQKYLCIEAGHKGPLFKCNIYKKKKAGKIFAKLLSLGQSKQWQDILGIFTGNKSRDLEAEPILEYFKPLIDWLKKKNKEEHIGWENENPMKCPE